jgi:hypothetical protein
MLLRETYTVNCENYTEHTDTLCGQKAEFYYVKAGGKYSNHWALKVTRRKLCKKTVVGYLTCHAMITT